MTKAERAQSKIDNVIASSLKGEGEFSSYFGATKRSITEAEVNNNSLREIPLTPEAIAANVKKKLSDYAYGAFKTDLQKALKGEKASDTGLEDIVGMAGAAGKAATDIKTGGIFGILSGMGTIMSNFGDYISAIWTVISGKSKADPSKSFFAKISDEIQDKKADRQLAEFASKKGANLESLNNSLFKDTKIVAQAAPKPVANEHAAQAQAAVVRPATPVVASSESLPDGATVPAQSVAANMNQSAALAGQTV